MAQALSVTLYVNHPPAISRPGPTANCRHPLPQLISILDPGIQGIAQPINDQIQSNFTAAVDFWAGRSGLIKIPTDLVPAATDLLAQLGPIIGQILPRDADDISAGAVSSRQNRGYCCGITQERINALGPDENAANDIPLPIRSAMSRAGLLF